jgi:hypothetical protein
LFSASPYRLLRALRRTLRTAEFRDAADKLPKTSARVTFVGVCLNAPSELSPRFRARGTKPPAPIVRGGRISGRLIHEHTAPA